MARGPGSTKNPGGITPARGRPRGTSRGRRRPRKAGAREAGGGPDAAPRVPWNVELAAPRRAEWLCAAAGAGGRWLLRSRSRREGNGPAGWVGRWEGRGRGGGGGRRTGSEGGSAGRAAGARSPRLGAGARTQPGAGAGRAGAGRPAGLGLGVWARGGVSGPREGRGAAGGGASPIPGMTPSRALGVWTRGDGGALRAWSSWTASAPGSKGARSQPWGGVRFCLRRGGVSLSRLLCASAPRVPWKWPPTRE